MFSTTVQALLCRHSLVYIRFFVKHGAFKRAVEALAVCPVTGSTTKRCRKPLYQSIWCTICFVHQYHSFGAGHALKLRNTENENHHVPVFHQLALRACGSTSGDSSSWRFDEHALFFEPESLPDIFRVLVGTTRHQPRMLGGPRLLDHCFHQRLIPRCPYPSVCQKYTAKTRISPLIFTLAWAVHALFARMDATAPSSLSTTAPRSLSVATKTPPDVCLQSSLLARSSVILAASAANLHPRLVSLLNCRSISSSFILCSIHRKRCRMCPCTFPCASFACSTPTLEQNTSYCFCGLFVPRSCSCFSQFGTFPGSVSLLKKFSGPVPGCFFLVPPILWQSTFSIDRHQSSPIFSEALLMPRAPLHAEPSSKAHLTVFAGFRMSPLSLVFVLSWNLLRLSNLRKCFSKDYSHS